MIDRVAHYQRVWDHITDESFPGAGGRKCETLLSGFVLHAVLDGRPLANIVTQWEIDADSLIDQSLTELRGFKACLPDYLGAFEERMPAHVCESFAALADYLVQVADHALARNGLRRFWSEVIPQLREEANYEQGRRRWTSNR